MDLMVLLNKWFAKCCVQVGDSVIGTHFIDLSTISNDGKTGELTQLNLYKKKKNRFTRSDLLLTGQVKTQELKEANVYNDLVIGVSSTANFEFNLIG